MTKKTLNIEKVYSGCGKNGTSTLLAVNAEYIKDFISATELPTTKDKISLLP